MPKFSESIVEEATIDWFVELGYSYLPGPDIAPDGEYSERTGYDSAVLENRLCNALLEINPTIPRMSIEEAVREVMRADAPTPILNNRMFHKMVTEGIDVTFFRGEREFTEKVWLFDFHTLENNDWLVVNQFTMVENHVNRRPDMVVFVNGLPLGVIELKNAADESADVKSAYNQLQTYKAQIPSLFTHNEVLLISDGADARVGALSADFERFLPWRTIDGESVAPLGMPMLETAIKGVFEPLVFLDLIRHFAVFEDDSGKVIKKLAAYHQFHAVQKAVECTKQASVESGDGRVGVVWHTQGSGKSLSMLFYAGKIIQALDNPTLVVITDRNDLDDQLFGTFALGEELLRQSPVQAESRSHLRELLQVSSGGVVFTTMQKFAPLSDESEFPMLSDRRNIVVIADEAHRSQYDLIDGFARHLRDGLPHASFIGFTGTPVELADRNTRAIFGEHISVYDIEQAVEDGATVRIYYEARLAKIDLDAAERPHIDPEFEELTEGEEISEQSRLKRKWSQLEAMVGTKKRLSLVAQDIVDHFERRAEIIEGKAMAVCMSRRICVDLFDEIIKLRPEWDDTDFAKGAVKVVMTGSASDPERYARHLMTGRVRKDIEQRFKDPSDPLKLVLVRDMWLTGFDVPSLHTMYVDKPMQGHGLMQAIARVNRVFKDKPGGLVVDYLGIAEQLKKAVANYTENGGLGSPTYDQAEAVAIMLEKYEVACGIMHGVDWSPYFDGSPAERLRCLTEAVEHVLAQEDGSKRMRGYTRQLAQAFALAGTHEQAMAIRDDIGFFQAVSAQLAKLDPRGGTGGQNEKEKINEAIKQLVSRSVSSDEVVDIFTAAGLNRPDISILDDRFLDEFSRMPQKNLAVEMLQKLLQDQIRTRSRTNLIQSKQFSELIEETIRRYQNRTIEAAEIIMELVEIAKQFNAAMKRGEELGLTDDEVAFYDALETNDSAVMELGDDTLKQIAHELVGGVRRSVTIDWTAKEAVKAQIRVMVKRILRKYGYPPDRQEKATRTILQQAELLCGDWVSDSQN
ncbi:type I restriction endonuclease subunit R [Tichowtungia aerotolerans]|uniref:Type I restriction enzyme endonuclease subunit n=1 Tax=Tichowtungia aerotolerans TaxID=2697043 RepID=A0A6P1MB29_9BACT|nr:type I restriction endonuclease subunit R [Tichowtungia aerotolerans]QHI68766.1 HsdR family type I site-specific deoxyribonuclease [Tichowtungia aerotolerans]